MERYIGEIKIMNNPKFEDIQILWMTNEKLVDNFRRVTINNPSVWFIYEEIIYWGLSKYEFKWFEQYTDFELPSGKVFDKYFPGEEEWGYMLNLGYTWRVLDYDKAILQADDLDCWCDYELQFIREWNRNHKIDNLLK